MQSKSARPPGTAAAITFKMALAGDTSTHTPARTSHGHHDQAIKFANCLRFRGARCEADDAARVRGVLISKAIKKNKHLEVGG